VVQLLRAKYDCSTHNFVRQGSVRSAPQTAVPVHRCFTPNIDRCDSQRNHPRLNGDSPKPTDFHHLLMNFQPARRPALGGQLTSSSPVHPDGSASAPRKFPPFSATEKDLDTTWKSKISRTIPCACALGKHNAAESVTLTHFRGAPHWDESFTSLNFL
jgi:hypothetical protein